MAVRLAAGLVWFVLAALAPEQHGVVGRERRGAAPERTAVGGAIAGAAARERGPGTGRAEPLVHVDVPTGVRTRELRRIDADAPKKAGQVVAATGEQGHLRQVALLPVAGRPDRARGERGRGAVRCPGHGDRAPPFAGLHDEGDVAAGGHVDEIEMAPGVGQGGIHIVPDRRVARVARRVPARDDRKLIREIRYEYHRAINGIAPRRVVDRPGDRRRGNAVDVDVARQR